jgi:hypothetical protein
MEKRTYMASVRAGALVAGAVMIVSVFAGPKIEFDTKNFNCGEVIEGKTEKINAEFIVRNTGNAVLTIKNVRPGCGCTVVRYDTTIPPGKSARIKAGVNIKGYRAGTIAKPVTVTSDAENEPVVRLSIEATIRAEIEVSERHLTFGGDDTASAKTIMLVSRKKDLKVSEVFFRGDGNPNRADPEWKKELPLPFTYTFTPGGSARPDGCYPFALKIAMMKFSAREDGSLIIKTNHPGKPEISIRTVIIPTQKAAGRK